MSFREDREIARWILRAGWLDRETLEGYLEEAKAHPDLDLCHLLVEDGLISPDQARRAAVEAQRLARHEPGRGAPAGGGSRRTAGGGRAAGPPRAGSGQAGRAAPFARAARGRRGVRRARGRGEAGADRAEWETRPRPGWIVPAVCMGGGLAAVVVVALLLTGGPSTRGPSETAGGPPENPAAAPAEVPVPRGPTAPAPKPGPALEGTAAGPAKAPESRAERERKAEETLGGILAAELAPCERITQLRDFCERESFAGTKAAARAKTELDALEKDYRRRATTAWREKEARAHEKEEQGACYEAWCICLAFQDEFPNTLEADNARSEGKRLERERDERWAETEGRIKSLLEAGEFDGVERLIAEVKRWGWPECNGKAEAYAARAARERLLRGEEGEEIVALPPGGEPSGPEAPGPGVPAPQDSPAPAAPGGPEGPGEPGPTAPEPGPGAPEPGPTPPEPGKTSTKPESPPTAFGATLEQLKEIFATDAVSIEDGRIVLKYQFGTLGGVNEELGADWTPKITHSRAAFVRWSEPWEGSIRRVFYGVRVSDNGRLEHMATWLADVEVTIRYLPAGQYRKGTFFAIGFHSDDKPTRWIGVNHGVQACRMQAAPRPTASGRVLAAEPAAARLPTVDHRYTMKMVLQGGTCGAYLNNRKRAEIGEREPLGKGKVGFIWWRSVVGTINSVEIKGKLDPAWVRDALGKGT